MKRVQKTLNLCEVASHLWSDYTITHSWIRGHPTSWKTYVANRVSEIQTTLPQALWHHVSRKDNPAELTSRGVSVQDLAQSILLFHGPRFLVNYQQQWPTDDNYHILEDCPEKRGPTCLAVRIAPSEPVNRLLLITARCKIFIESLPEQLIKAQ